MVHSNLGRLYLWLGENDKAVPEFKDAIKIDSATNKLGGSHTDQLSLDLARGLFRQGKYNDTVRFAKNTLKLIDERADSDPEYKGKLIQILCDSLDQVGKQAESALLERSARREGLL